MIKHIVCVFVLLTFVYGISASNLTCYQCIKNNENEECGPEYLLPCPSSSDRCVIHFTKTKNSFVVKRECGLAPCAFDDEMAVRGLGMNCDRSRKEYFCTSCCKENGCNRNSATTIKLHNVLIFFTIAFICILNLFRDFIPPFVQSENMNNYKK
ncbi:uncharacterized protein LOC115886052 [Sitophilus oryzae]|uniref:Uncharacterized protein LOC115886052 n=1 Tax=Sitophilus oryzae TaxID=7048 RepID=A0A6J2YBV3_SITOR|nr:uncharacterized protein LOC115886052 [Sitophilus oryzae]